ncbi:hypothetical protein [Tamlana sp. I1]|uniref:hypothetical protein n=1 Tax=Tamlana sp. I1 TaxID=2762061 RepID=UPI00188F12AE|nr:hypothetical protein [Tamlana sp. I1]
MSRQFISTILSMIFLAFIAAPTIIKMVDDSIDVSFYYSYAEEEEKGATKNVTKEVIVLEELNSESLFLLSTQENTMPYVFKTYSNPYFNLVSPPPDFT